MTRRRPLCGHCPDCLALTRELTAPPKTTRERVVELVRAGRSTAEIVKELGTTAAAVATHKSRARKAGAL